LASEHEVSPGCIILDACCLINLYGSGRMAEILEAIPTVFAVAEFVAREEALRIYAGPPGRVTEEVENIDLGLLIESGRLEIVGLQDDEEKATFVELAAHLDDGEAMTGALALHRGWTIATDDRKAIRVFGEIAPGSLVISTPQLIRAWVDMTHPDEDEVVEVLKNIRLRARYEPGANHPLNAWWHARYGIS